jgi:hypothetical protein
MLINDESLDQQSALQLLLSLAPTYAIARRNAGYLGGVMVLPPHGSSPPSVFARECWRVAGSI